MKNRLSKLKISFKLLATSKKVPLRKRVGRIYTKRLAKMLGRKEENSGSMNHNQRAHQILLIRLLKSINSK